MRMIHFCCVTNTLVNWIQIQITTSSNIHKTIKFLIPPENKRLITLINNVKLAESDNNIVIDELVCLCLAVLPSLNINNDTSSTTDGTQNLIYCYFNFFCSNYIHNYCFTKMNICCYPVMPFCLYNVVYNVPEVKKNIVFSMQSNQSKIKNGKEANERSVVCPVIIGNCQSFEKQIKQVDLQLVKRYNIKDSIYIILFYCSNPTDFTYNNLCDIMTICMCLEEKKLFQFEHSINNMFFHYLCNLAFHI